MHTHFEIQYSQSGSLCLSQLFPHNTSQLQNQLNGLSNSTPGKYIAVQTQQARKPKKKKKSTKTPEYIFPLFIPCYYVGLFLASTDPHTLWKVSIPAKSTLPVTKMRHHAASFISIISLSFPGSPPLGISIGDQTRPAVKLDNWPSDMHMQMPGCASWLSNQILAGKRTVGTRKNDHYRTRCAWLLTLVDPRQQRDVKFNRAGRIAISQTAVWQVLAQL